MINSTVTGTVGKNVNLLMKQTIGIKDAVIACADHRRTRLHAHSAIL